MDRFGISKGHAAKSNETIDPVVIAGQIIVGPQALVSRNTNPLKALMISVTKFNAGQRPDASFQITLN